MRYGVVGSRRGGAPFRPHRFARATTAARHGNHGRHSILMDLPLFNIPTAGRRPLQALLRRWHREPFRCHPALRGWRLDPLVRGRAVFIYHSVNAWEEGHEVVLDVCRVKQRAALGPRRPACADALLSATRRASAPIPVRPAHGADDRAGSRRRQRRVPVGQPGNGGGEDDPPPTRCTSRRRRRCFSMG